MVRRFSLLSLLLALVLPATASADERLRLDWSNPEGWAPTVEVWTSQGGPQ